VRVNDLLWEEVPSLYARAPDERIYTTELGESGTTTVRFGNGKQGARLPSGNNNVRAEYRKGIGLGGMVAAGLLSQLMTRPLGVKAVVNPLAAEGAQDAESIDDARRNAPLKILTLDRVVSLQDYEDFARAFAGIGKAAATWTWSGERNGVFLTVAGAGGSTLTTTGETVTNLVAALHALGDPRVPLTLQPYRPVAVRLAAGLTIAPEYQADIVLAAAEEQLLTAFSFDAREFGQSVALSEVVAVIHRVEGVTAVNVTELYREDEPAGRNALLFAFLPRAGTDTPVPGELLTIQQDTIALEVLS
jgi:predicted phage baseplate assembly protein